MKGQTKMTAKTAINTARELAIKYDEESFYWWKMWHDAKMDDTDMYYSLWQEKNHMCYAMLELLDSCEPFYHHTVVNGKIYKELID